MPPAFEFYWTSFVDLSTERQIGMGLGPIPRSAMRAYGAEFDLAGDELENFCAIIRAMDDEYLKLTAPKAPEKVAEVRADDPEGVRGVFGRLRARADAKKQGLGRGKS